MNAFETRASAELEGTLRAMQPQDRNILQILFESPVPLTVQQVHTEYIIRVVNFLAFKYDLVAKPPKFFVDYDSIAGKEKLYGMLQLLGKTAETCRTSHAIKLAEEMLVRHCRIAMSVQELQDRLNKLVEQGYVIENKEGLFSTYALNSGLYARILYKDVILL